MDLENIAADYRQMPKRKRRFRRRSDEPAVKLYIGEWIRALGSKPARVAKEVGVNEGYLSELINGTKINPSDDLKAAIADFLDIPVGYLFQPPPSKQFIEQSRSLDMGVLNRLRLTQPKS